MKLLSALFDTILLPVAASKDVLDAMVGQKNYKSNLRAKIEEIEDNLR